MSTAENIAAARRVDAVALEIETLTPIRFRTVLVVCGRGPEPRCASIDDVHEYAKPDPAPVVLRRIEDLDVLIDAEHGVHLHRLEGDDPEFDEAAEGCRLVEVEIQCHEGQVDQILSCAPTTATTGGARAGKTRILVWWLFRQWLIRGHGSFGHDRVAVFWWIREDSEKLYQHAVKWIEALWPPEAITSPPANPKARNFQTTLFGGSRIDYRHAHHSGRRAGTNLRSESVEATVVDELSAILAVENYYEIVNRLGQTGGPLATAYTPTSGHWHEDEIEKAVPLAGGAIVLKRLDVFSNPWWPLARVWSQFLRDRSLTATQLLEQVLPADDQPAAARATVTDRDARRRHFGEPAPMGLVLWREWDPERWIVRDAGEFRSSFSERGRPRLKNITGQTAGRVLGRTSIDRAGGKDFNVNPNVTIVYQVFGDPQRPLVLILDEIADLGPTVRNAERVASLHPGLGLFVDPTGAMPAHKHESHGDRSFTDAEELRRAGLDPMPANGWATKGKVRHLGQLNSIGVMHSAMRLGLLRVHSRCTGVLRALTDMRAKPEGTIAKVSGVNSVSDQVSGYGDAVRYGLWPIWRHLLEETATVSR